MDNLGVINLYQNTDKNRKDEFLKKTESSLKVKTDYNKVVQDTDWIGMIREIIPYLDKIIRNPKRFIKNEEEIIKIEQVKKVEVETIKHLSKHTNLIQTIDKKTGDVTPKNLLNVRKEETFNTYENRMIYTLIQNMELFISIRKEKILNQSNQEKKQNQNNKDLEYNGNTVVNDEKVDINVKLNSSLDNTHSKGDDKNKELLEQIDAIELQIKSLKSSDVYKALESEKAILVRDPIKKTNVILKNVNFQYAMKLWNYLRENLDAKDTNDEEHKDYEDNGELKELMDEDFFLQYLTMKTLDEDRIENRDTKKEIENTIVTQMIDRALDFNEELSEDDFKQMVAMRYEVIKYRKGMALKDIQEIFKIHIKKYIEEKIEGNK